MIVTVPRRHDSQDDILVVLRPFPSLSIELLSSTIPSFESSVGPSVRLTSSVQRARTWRELRSAGCYGKSPPCSLRSPHRTHRPRLGSSFDRHQARPIRKPMMGSQAGTGQRAALALDPMWQRCSPRGQPVRSSHKLQSWASRGGAASPILAVAR